MATKIRDIGDEEILRFLRFSVTESAAATYTEQSLDTQLSIERGMIWLIRAIEWEINPSYIDDPAAGANETLQGQITREPQTEMLHMSDSDCIAHINLIKNRSSAIGTDAGPIVIFDKYPLMQQFPIPLPYAARTIYIGAKSTAGAAKTVRGRIHYTLRRVSEKFFYRVAHALIN